MNHTLLKICAATTLINAGIANAVIVPPPAVPAEHYIIIDNETGSAIAEKNADEKRHIASLTKLMTAYVVFNEIEEGTLSLEDKVRVSNKAWKATGSSMFIEVGKTVSVDDLIKGMLVVSGNDAAIALSEHIAGTEEEFVAIMNAYSKKLGMDNTLFGNSTGLPTSIKNAHSTARDISILSREIIKRFPEHYSNFKLKEFEYESIKQRNRNALLFDSPHYDGLKTGFTNAAGYNLASSFMKDDRRVTTVVLGAKTSNDRFLSAKSLTNYGFRRFHNVDAVTTDMVIHDIPVYYGTESTVSAYPATGYTVTLPRPLSSNDNSNDIVLKAYFDSNGDAGTILFAPITDSYQVGSLEVHYKDQLLKTIPLITNEKMEQGTWFGKFKDWVALSIIDPLKK
ncbi:D-alanyl-D-alanine carboxypeptidase [Vibrio chagasii]|nr:D-alanyl-D-alanine carboxypeptidase [Vibrio chagasii]